MRPIFRTNLTLKNIAIIASLILIQSTDGLTQDGLQDKLSSSMGKGGLFSERIKEAAIQGLQKTVITCALEQPLINFTRLKSADPKFSIIDFYKNHGIKGGWMTVTNTALQYPVWGARFFTMNSMPFFLKEKTPVPEYCYPFLTALPLSAIELMGAAQKRLAILEVTGRDKHARGYTQSALISSLLKNKNNKKKIVGEIFKGSLTDLRGSLISWSIYLYGLKGYEQAAKMVVQRPLTQWEQGIIGGAAGAGSCLVLSSYSYLLVNMQKINPEKNLGSDFKNFKSLIILNGWKSYFTVLSLSLARFIVAGASTNYVLVDPQ